MDQKTLQMLINGDHGARRNWFASVNTALRDNVARVQSLRSYGDEWPNLLAEEVKFLRSQMSPSRSRVTTDADLEGDAADRLRARREANQAEAIRAARANATSMGEMVAELRHVMMAPRLPHIDTSKATSPIEALLLRNNQLLALAEARARVAPMSIEDRVALLGRSDDGELAYVLEEALNRDVTHLLSPEGGHAARQKAIDADGTKDAAAAVARAELAVKQRIAKAQGALDVVRNARYGKEDWQLFTEHEALAAESTRAVESEIRLVQTVPAVAAA